MIEKSGVICLDTQFVVGTLKLLNRSAEFIAFMFYSRFPNDIKSCRVDHKIRAFDGICSLILTKVNKLMFW